MRSWFKIIGGLGLGMAGFASPAAADAFGPATTGFFFSSPNLPSYSYNNGEGTLNLADSIAVSGGTGTFSSITNGTSSGTLTFSLTAGTKQTETIANLFTFVDSSGGANTGTYTFSLQFVYTESQDNIGSSDNETLYLYGTTSGGSSSSSPASIELAYSGLHGLDVNDSSSFSDPPKFIAGVTPSSDSSSAVPEPISLALLGGGVVVVGALRRFLRR